MASALVNAVFVVPAGGAVVGKVGIIMQTEPIRWAVYITALASAVGTFLVTWSETGDWRVALGTALLGFALPAVGGEVARRQAYAPATVDRILDADAVISQAERGDG